MNNRYNVSYKSGRIPGKKGKIALETPGGAQRFGTVRQKQHHLCCGMGSYHRLVAFISDFPGIEDHWHELRVLERCGNCKACMKACPTEAITPDRFLLHRARCLAFHNERKGEFPQWISPGWHNCLIGCQRKTDTS